MLMGYSWAASPWRLLLLKHLGGDLQGSRGYCWAGPAGGKGRTGQDQGAGAEKSLPQRKGGGRQRRKCQKQEKQVGGREPRLGAAEAYKGLFYASGN